MGVHVVKNLPAVQETWVRSLGQEDPLEGEMATHSSILAWRIPMARGAWRAIVRRVAELDTTEQLTLSLFKLLGPVFIPISFLPESFPLRSSRAW